MPLLRLLLKNSGWLVILATLTGLLAGGSSAGLIAIINFALLHLDQPPSWLPWLFLCLCGLLSVTYTVSQVVLTSLAQDVVYTLRLQLTRQILNCPLQHLELLGVPKLLATLTEDVEAIAASSASVSILCTSSAIVLACWVYLCWLSPLLFLIMIGVSVVILYTLQFLIVEGQRIFTKARDVQDRLFQHFQAVTVGTKELKLHYVRRQAFFAEELVMTLGEVRKYWLRGMTMYALVGGVGFALVFLMVGLFLFALPAFMTISASLLTSYVLTILFLITPINGILGLLPQVAQANVALAKVESLGLSLAAQTTERFKMDALAQPLWRSWMLEGVTHTYLGGDHPFTLGP
ncbi:MAG: ABC transporter transmembrane domain-containing protein, partial [Cyanobacteria bacterium P01_A01_bin.17]